MKTLVAITGIALAGLAGAAAAQQDGAAETAFPAGWYVAPMATYMMADTARCSVDDGPGGALALGHRGDFASIELWGQYLALSRGTCTYTVPAPTQLDPDARATVVEPEGEVSLNGGGLNLVLGPFFDGPWLARLFGVVGFGVLQRKDHPHYVQDDTTIFGDAGLGYLHPFELFGIRSSARVEVRYRYDMQPPPHPDDHDPAPPHAYSDLIVNLGLQFALSPAPEPAPPAAPEPVTVVAPADADGDGVPDERDQCPDTPAGTVVTDSGCEPAAPALVTLETARAGDTIVLHGVNFETARATLTVNAARLLDGVAQQLDARPELRVEIGGHTDDRGSDAYNQTLSEQRAQSVQAYLADKGVDAGRLSAVGYGESLPVAGNDTDEGRERNRRVELKVLE